MNVPGPCSGAGQQGQGGSANESASAGGDRHSPSSQAELPDVQARADRPQGQATGKRTLQILWRGCAPTALRGQRRYAFTAPSGAVVAIPTLALAGRWPTVPAPVNAIDWMQG